MPVPVEAGDADADTAGADFDADLRGEACSESSGSPLHATSAITSEPRTRAENNGALYALEEWIAEASGPDMSALTIWRKRICA